MEAENEYAQIVEMVLSGNKQAYSQLYDKTIHNVYRTVYFLIDEKTDIDDLIQGIYFQVFKTLKKYDYERDFKPWLMGIVMKQIHAYRRKRWMNLRILKKVESYEQSTVLDFSNDVIDKISKQQLLHVVNELPYKLKQIIILRYFQEYSQEEVAKILNIPPGTVKSRTNAALKKLRNKVENKNFKLERVGNI